MFSFQRAAEETSQIRAYSRAAGKPRRIDDLTVELTTKEPDSFLPINLTNLFMSSPAKWQKLFETAEGADAKAKSQAAWAAFAREASGTGPWKMSKFTPRERLELVKNDGYWDKARVPKIDKMVLLPMPEANARTAALLSGDVQVIENVPTSDAAKLKQDKRLGIYRTVADRLIYLHLDSDRDGVTNYDEVDAGTDILSKDTDLDNVEDKTELDQGSDPNDGASPRQATRAIVRRRTALPNRGRRRTAVSRSAQAASRRGKAFIVLSRWLRTGSGVSSMRSSRLTLIVHQSGTQRGGAAERVTP